MAQHTPPLRRFGNLQWYLAHSGNRVHLLAACPDEVSEQAFRGMVGRLLHHAPHFSWAESLKLGGHLVLPLADPDEVSKYHHLPEPGLAPGDLATALARPLADTGRPAFRASCHTAAAPDAHGVRSWVLLEATHGVTEGGDIAAILRDRGAEHDERPLEQVRLGPGRRLAVAAIVPFAWLASLLLFNWPRRAAGDFGFVRLSLDRAGVAAAARRLGVSQRAFLFGLAAHAFLHDPRRRRRLNLAYTVLPKARAAGHDDQFLNLRMDGFRLRTGDDLATSLQRTEAALAARGPAPIFIQTLQNALLGWHRAAMRLMPWLYARAWGYTPYDLVLSLMPPIRPTSSWGPLARATCFAGSNIGTTPNCIFTVGRRQITLGIWLSPALAARRGAVLRAAAELGIAAEDWT